MAQKCRWVDPCSRRVVQSITRWVLAARDSLYSEVKTRPALPNVGGPLLKTGRDMLVVALLATWVQRANLRRAEASIRCCPAILAAYLVLTNAF